MNKVGIIGAGASGIMAALMASEGGACVTLFEKKDRIGKKILVTGNGRCNFTNLAMSGDYYYTDDKEFIDSVYKTFGNEDLIAFFRQSGLMVKNKNGYIYPACEQAASVLDILRIALKEKNVEIKTETDIVDIKALKSGFSVKSIQGDSYYFDKIILASGGKSSLPKNEKANGYELCKSLGLKCTRLYPALTQIKCEGLNFNAISGVRQECEVSFISDDNVLMQQRGELLFTDSGISGIVSFQLSHLAAEYTDLKKKALIKIDLICDYTDAELRDYIFAKCLLYPNLTCEEIMIGILNKKLNVEILKHCGVKPSSIISTVSKESVEKLIYTLKNLELKITGTSGFENSQVTGGGILLSEINLNCEVKSIPGLYITGELLNVDGICGGYNLQWAFSTGYIAGKSSSH